MDLSIIIVTYNSRDFALETLNSYHQALRACRELECEIIVVDNASADGVPEAIAAHPSGPRLIRNRENAGLAKANNLGFRQSSGRYLLFSNPDVQVEADTLPALVSLMDAHPQVGACTPRLMLTGGRGIDWGCHRGFPTPWAAFTYFSGLARIFGASRRLSRIFGRYQLLDRDLASAHEVDVIEGGFFFARRTAFTEAGPWDEDYFLFGEDIDLCLQIKRRHHAIMYYPQARAWHHLGGTTGLKRRTNGEAAVARADRERAYHAFFDAMMLFYDKNYRHDHSALTARLVRLGIETGRLRRRLRLEV